MIETLKIDAVNSLSQSEADLLVDSLIEYLSHDKKYQNLKSIIEKNKREISNNIISKQSELENQDHIFHHYISYPII
jgi:hypothetical protein